VDELRVQVFILINCWMNVITKVLSSCSLWFKRTSQFERQLIFVNSVTEREQLKKTSSSSLNTDSCFSKSCEELQQINWCNNCLEIKCHCPLYVALTVELNRFQTWWQTFIFFVCGELKSASCPPSHPLTPAPQQGRGRK